MLARRGLGGEVRGPRGPGASLGMLVKSSESEGSEAWAGRGEHGACRPTTEREVRGEWDGEEYMELV